jgi:hypothetical protein
MNAPLRPVSLGVLAAAALLLGYLSGVPYGFGVVLVAGGVLGAAALRRSESGAVAGWAPVPVLLVLAIEAVGAPVGLGSELVAGLAAVAFLIWLADDPGRPVGGAVRGLPTVAVPALAVGIAWSSALFLPAKVVPLGVAGALLAFALAAVALLLARPSAFDREEA